MKNNKENSNFNQENKERLPLTRIIKSLALNILEFSLILAATGCNYSYNIQKSSVKCEPQAYYSGPSCAINIPGYNPHRHPWQQ